MASPKDPLKTPDLRLQNTKQGQRAPFQVLVLPFLQTESGLSYAVFERSENVIWQGIAGGGEDQETPLQAAQREAFEEAGIGLNTEWIPLDSMVTIPVIRVAGFLWGLEVLVIPEYAFGVAVTTDTIQLSAEHRQIKWCDYESANGLLSFDSNRNALWELNQRLTRNRADR